MDHLTFQQQVIMGLIHGGVPSAVATIVGALIIRNQRKHAAMHDELNDGLEDKIHNAVKKALQNEAGK